MDTCAVRIAVACSRRTTMRVRLTSPSGTVVTVGDRFARHLRRLGWGAAEQSAEKPSTADLKAVWVDYATTWGMSRAEAEAMTKADLVERFG
jgi:subtilisin-like proprotein convertase family protein